MIGSRYIHAVVAFPLTVYTQYLSYLDDYSVRGDRLREIIEEIRLYWVCQAPFGANIFHIHTVTCEVDVDGGNFRNLKNRWSSIEILAAWHQSGLQVGQSWGRDSNGNAIVVGTPRFTITNAQKTVLKAAWPQEFVMGSSLLLPPNVSQGQIAWSLN